MAGDWDEGDSRLARMVANPVSLRRRARFLLVLLAILTGIPQTIDGGFLTSMAFALAWVCGPFAAIGVAIGDAFFLRHGRGGRRLAVMAIVCVIAALGACAVLAVVTKVSQSQTESLLAAAFYPVLYLALFLALASVLAIAIGKSGDYLAGRMGHLSDDDW